MERTPSRRPVGDVTRRRRAAALSWAAALALAVSTRADAAASSPAVGELRGTYRLSGTARVDAGPILSREAEVRADAVIARGDRPRALRVRLAAEGHVCELAATREDPGELLFAKGQRCVVDVQDPGARGRVEATLREGRGRVRDRTLALDLVFELSGALAVRTRDRVEVLGREVELPAGWTPELPVRGEARARAEGKRDDSRAADRSPASPSVR